MADNEIMCTQLLMDMCFDSGAIVGQMEKEWEEYTQITLNFLLNQFDDGVNTVFLRMFCI